MEEKINTTYIKTKEAVPSFGKEKKTFSLCVPVDAILFLSKESSFRNPSRFSKMEAFADIVNRYIMALSDSSLEKSANIAKLVKHWCWTRVTVTKFIGQLQIMNIVIVGKLNSETCIYLNPKVLHWNEDTLGLTDDCREASSQSQPSMQHISSGETKENEQN